MSAAGAIDLIEHVLGEDGGEKRQAARLLSLASELGVDPLAFCAHRLGLGEAAVLERAAHWAGLAFSAVIPSPIIGGVEFRRLDALAELRTLRGLLLDREISYLAPHFDDILQLRRRAEERPAIRREICIVPASAIRTAATAANSQRLYEEARQRLARRWPFASAHLDLTRAARAGFVMGLMVLAVGAALAPLWYKPLLVPILGVILVGPALLRLAAVALPGKPAEKSPVLSDAELPIYSVLIPLRDEAHMVPLLQGAMSALDYPALCIKRTKF